jgi:triacylglycerol lipase
MKPADLTLRCALLSLALSLVPLRAADAKSVSPEPLSAPASDLAANTSAPPETVVLLHGLGLNRFAMTRLACALRRDGYRVINASYPSRSVPLEKLASTWLPDLLRAHQTNAEPRIHFVTHSMGGILLRLHLRDHAPANLGRVVMIAPPNHGSEVADRLQKNFFFRLFTGRNGHRLGTGADSVPRQLGPLDADLGIIAGSRSLNPLFSAWIGRPSDGKVAIESTKLAGMRDHVVLPISHTWLQYRGPVIAQVKSFLREGKFQPVTL